MSEILDPATAMQVVRDASDCGDHRIEVGFTQEDIEKVLYLEVNDKDWDTDSHTIFRLKNGKYVFATEWSDSSGHG